MAAGTEGVVFGLDLRGVGIVAIAAADPRLIHFGLHKGTVDVDLIKDLAIGVVESRSQKLR